MPREPRHFEPHSLLEITTRTMQGRLLMRPSRLFNEIFTGILGYSQAKYGLELHSYAALSNHYHFHCSPEDPEQLQEFMRLFNSKLAKEIGRLYDWRDKVWSRRFRSISISDEPEAQIARLKYVLAHGVKEGLVASPHDWPGPHCVHALTSGSRPRGLWFNRSLEYEANRRGLDLGARDFSSVQEVVLTPLPCWGHLTPEEYRRRIAQLVSEIEDEARIERLNTGKEPHGVAFVLRQEPHERAVRSKRSPAPAVHAATKAVRQAMRSAFREFVGAYRRACERLRAGEFDVEFPPHCFPPPRPFSRGAPSFAPT